MSVDWKSECERVQNHLHHMADECENLRLEVKRMERKLRGSTEAYSGLLADARRDRDEAREIACKLLRIAEGRGPKVFGPRPEWLKYED